MNRPRDSQAGSLSSSEKYGEAGRTVDTPTTAQTLPAWYDCRAVSKRRARAADMCTCSARTRRKVRQEACGLSVCRVIVRWWARLEYEDAQVGVCRGKTACDDTTSSATYSLCQKKVGHWGGRGCRTTCDDNIVLFVDLGGCRHSSVIGRRNHCWVKKGLQVRPTPERKWRR